MCNLHSICAHTHTPSAIHAQAWTGGDTEWQAGLTLQLVCMPLFGLLDYGQSLLAPLVDRFVQQFDYTDDPGLPVHGVPTQMSQTCAVYI